MTKMGESVETVHRGPSQGNERPCLMRQLKTIMTQHECKINGAATISTAVRPIADMAGMAGDVGGGCYE